jgi:hypothetical protein
MCLYPFGASANMNEGRKKDIPPVLMLEIIEELGLMICADLQEGKSCIERVRPYDDCCFVCRAKTILELPEIEKRNDR